MLANPAQTFDFEQQGLGLEFKSLSLTFKLKKTRLVVLIEKNVIRGKGGCYSEST